MLLSVNIVPLGWVTICGQVNHDGIWSVTQVYSAWPSLWEVNRQMMRYTSSVSVVSRYKLESVPPCRPRMSKIKNDLLDQYGAEPFEEQQFAAAGFIRVNSNGNALCFYGHLTLCCCCRGRVQRTAANFSRSCSVSAAR